MSDPSTQWSAWTRRLATAGQGPCTLRSALHEIAREVSDRCPVDRSRTRRWQETGIEVRKVPMRGRGRCWIGDTGGPFVEVNATDNPATQQFTVAHELAHLLLGSLPPEQLAGFSRRQEEGLCDEFARHVIIPPHQLADALAGDDEPLPSTVLKLCGTFGANPSAILRALSTQLPLEQMAYLFATWRHHYRRRDVVGFRIDAVAGPRGLFWPYETRIETVGLECLARDAATANHAATFDGCEEQLVVQLRRVQSATGANHAVGRARWHALRHGWSRPYLLVRIDCSELRYERLSRSQRAGADAAPTAVAAPAS
jgi:IrrE N-terminal-like domain